MPKQKTKELVVQPALEDIYNFLMLDIEPELMIYMLPELPKMYAKESEKERRERGKRYAHAFEVFSKRFTAVLKAWKQELIDFQKNILKALKEEASAEDVLTLSDIEKSLEDV